MKILQLGETSYTIRFSIYITLSYVLWAMQNVHYILSKILISISLLIGISNYKLRLFALTIFTKTCNIIIVIDTDVEPILNYI